MEVKKREPVIERPLFVIALICCIVLVNLFRPSPLDEINFTDCTVGVCIGYDRVFSYLSKEQTDEFLTVIKHADIGMSVGTAYTDLVGGHVKTYRVFFKNGEILDISSYDVMLIINRCGYKCDKQTLDKLNKCWDEIYDIYYKSN